jgi:hypothetical protein
MLNWHSQWNAPYLIVGVLCPVLCGGHRTPKLGFIDILPHLDPEIMPGDF